MMIRVLVLSLSLWPVAVSFNIKAYTHYLDYLPFRYEGLAAYETFHTAPMPPSALRNRKMEIPPGTSMNVEDVLVNPIWPTRWPYSYEDFRPCDYTRDEIINTLPQYQFTQSLITADNIIIIPGFLSVPIDRHFILPKDKISLSEHMNEYFFDGAKVLELFSTYESILPSNAELGPTVGVGWSSEEMGANPDLDDYIEQDITVDPFLPLASNYFDFVIMPANFQTIQRPKDMFQEINRVLKPGGMAIIGVKLSMWAFLGWKSCRYYTETNYLEDIFALGSFFHYAEGFSKPKAFDLELPELNIVGKLKDLLCPQPRLDFYACVQAKKKKNSPHGRVEVASIDKDKKEGYEEEEQTEPVVEGRRYAPKIIKNPITKEERLGPYY